MDQSSKYDSLTNDLAQAIDEKDLPKMVSVLKDSLESDITMDELSNIYLQAQQGYQTMLQALPVGARIYIQALSIINNVFEENK